MPVTVLISTSLRVFAGGRDRIVLEGSPATVADALEALWTQYPGLRDRVANEERQIREHVNVFVGRENIRYTGGLGTPVPDNAELSIFHAVSGG